MWYYAENSEQRGPVTKEDLIAKLKSGELTGETLVWTNNMQNWAKASTVEDLKEAFASLNMEQAPEEPTVIPDAEISDDDKATMFFGPINHDEDTIKLRPTGGGVGEQSQEAQNAQLVPQAAQPSMLTCQQCGRAVAPSEAINYQGTVVCPACKQQFLNNMYEEHGTNAVDYPIASVWARWGAIIIDNIILSIVNCIITIVLTLIFEMIFKSLKIQLEYAQMAAKGIGGLLGFIIYIAYETFCTYKYAATPGKMVLGLKVLHNGGNLSFGRAIGRTFAKTLSSIICSIGFIMAFFTQDSKALHDMMCETSVVSTK